MFRQELHANCILREDVATVAPFFDSVSIVRGGWLKWGVSNRFRRRFHWAEMNVRPSSYRSTLRHRLCTFLFTSTHSSLLSTRSRNSAERELNPGATCSTRWMTKRWKMRTITKTRQLRGQVFLLLRGFIVPETVASRKNVLPHLLLFSVQCGHSSNTF